MTPKFEHFLITRFNLKFKEWAITKQGEDVTSEAWLNHRFKLFETYCYPSITQQTNLNFKWLVCFDSETPDFYKDKIQILHQAFPNFIPVYIEDSSKANSIILETIYSYCSEQTTHVITSRLDNDDGLHCKYVETVQNNCTSTSPLIIDLVNGFQLVIKSDMSPVVRTISAAFNPFVSLIEEKKNCQTVLSRKHLDWKNHPHRTIVDEPLWLQVIHEKNISNSEKLHFKETNRIQFSDFGITKSFKLKSNVNIALSTIINSFKRLFLKLNLMKS